MNAPSVELPPPPTAAPIGATQPGAPWGSTPPSEAGRPSRIGRLRRWYAAHRPEVALVVLAITIPELLTGSTPVTNLINPIAVAGLLGLYGAGVLAIRELSLRWKTGWTGVLLLGLAYGIAEEGIATKTMVDPHSGAAGFLGVYGHFLGVNWVFAVVIALFHALFSIALPILIVDRLYPTERGRRLLSDTGLRNALLVLGATVTAGYFLFDPRYFEGYAVLGLLLGAMALLVLAARVVPRTLLEPPRAEPDRSPRWFLGLGIAFAFSWSVFYLFAPHLIAVPAVVIAGEIAGAAGALVLVRQHIGRRAHERHLVYLAAGLLAWYIPWMLVVVLLGDVLALPVLVAVYALLLILARRFPAGPVPVPRGALA